MEVDACVWKANRLTFGKLQPVTDSKWLGFTLWQRFYTKIYTNLYTKIVIPKSKVQECHKLLPRVCKDCQADDVPIICVHWTLLSRTPSHCICLPTLPLQLYITLLWRQGHTPSAAPTLFYPVSKPGCTQILNFCTIKIIVYGLTCYSSKTNPWLVLCTTGGHQAVGPFNHWQGIKFTHFQMQCIYTTCFNSCVHNSHST